MASGFSLGAAIGATGKFPKLKSPEIDSAASDRQARELQAVRNRVTADNTKYHNVFINQNKDETTKFIVSMLQAEKMKDPEVVSKIYTGESELNAKRNEYLVASKYFFDLENKIEDAKNQKTVEYVSPSMETLYKALRESRSEEELYQRYIQNPEMFADGYVEMSKMPDGRVVPVVNFHNKYDFPMFFAKGNLFNLKEKGVIITETKKTTKEGREIDRFISIPVDKAEALELKKTDPNINENANAFDLGKEWFRKEVDAQRQYRSQLATDGKPDALDPYKMTFDDLYLQLFNEAILPNIPKKYENKDALFVRTNINVKVDTKTRTAPTEFVAGRMTTNYMKNQDNTPGTLSSDLAAPVADDPEGKGVQVPSNQYILDMDGKPAFSTKTTQSTFVISRVAIFPAILKVDPATNKNYLRPITDEEKASYDAEGKKYLMYPFALGNQQLFRENAAPQLGYKTYMIPLFEPDANGRWIVPKESRSGSSTKGSLILSQITARDWDAETQKNWDKTFFTLMGGVKDQDDIKQK